MKKLGSLLLVFLMLGTISVTAFASETTDKMDGQVLTEQTPDHIIEVAQSEIGDLLKNHLEGEPKDAYTHSYALGHPINLKDSDSQNRIYDFPIMRDGQIFAIFTIYDDEGDYSFQLEENMMASQLQLMQEKGLLKNTTLASNDDGFFAVTNDSIIPLTPDSELQDVNASKKDVFSIDATVDNSSLIPVNISDPVMTFTIKGNDADIKATTSKVLGVKSVPQTGDGTFTGTQKNWCGAAVTAAIINYKKSTSLTAKSVTIEALGSAVNKGITNSQVVSVGENHGLSPKSGNPLSYTSVKSQINASQPIYMQMERTKDDGTKAYHALGLIGYSSSKYTVINPWYEKSLTITKKDTGSDVTYVTGTRTYKWHKSVYNWK